jgi:hypothetical protein
MVALKLSAAKPHDKCESFVELKIAISRVTPDYQRVKRVHFEVVVLLRWKYVLICKHLAKIVMYEYCKRLGSVSVYFLIFSSS